ncbi:MAG: GDP-mannose 4,6-dehydratase [Treponematales bacterium]
MKILITGVAGFIGYHLAKRLAGEGHEITAIDNINDYYDVDLKYGRLTELGLPVQAVSDASVLSTKYPNLRFMRKDIACGENVKALFRREHFEYVVHLAAQAGVRYSLTHPDLYIASNVQGFLNLLEAIRETPVKHLVYASSSSVYGLNTKQPFSETDAADCPASLYAATKKTCELMAHTYAHLYKIPATGLRFFTVYGPWGRPDMAPFLFTRAILEGKAIDVFNNGNMSRDFTYIDDIVEGVVRVMAHIPASGAAGSAPAKIYNIGNGKPVALLDFIHTLEETLGTKAKMNMLPMQPGDVPVTWADCSALERVTGFRPGISIQEGVSRFAAWYREYYKA